MPKVGVAKDLRNKTLNCTEKLDWLDTIETENESGKLDECIEHLSDGVQRSDTGDHMDK